MLLCARTPQTKHLSHNPHEISVVLGMVQNGVPSRMRRHRQYFRSFKEIKMKNVKKNQDLDSIEVSEWMRKGKKALDLTREALFGDSGEFTTSFVNFMGLADLTTTELKLMILLHYATKGMICGDTAELVLVRKMSGGLESKSESMNAKIKAGAIFWIRLFPVEIEKVLPMTPKALQRALSSLEKRKFILVSPFLTAEKLYAIDYCSIDFYFHNAFENGLPTRHIHRHIRRGSLIRKKHRILRIAKPIMNSLGNVMALIRYGMIMPKHNQN